MNVIILHGCPPNKESVMPKRKRWMHWLEKELNARNIDAVALTMPTPWSPKYEEWKRTISSEPVNKDTILIGHSCGAAFLVRYLLDTHKKLRKLILVAPAKIPETKDDMRKSLYEFELPADGSHIAKEIVIFISNDLPHHLQSFSLYRHSLKPRVVKLENKGHFFIFTMGKNKFPELLQEVLA